MKEVVWDRVLIPVHLTLLVRPQDESKNIVIASDYVKRGKFMDNISQSSDIKELFSKLLVTKNKLKLIKSYYSNLSDSLVTDLDKLYNDLTDGIDWMGNQLGDVESRQSELAQEVNVFTALTSPEIEIVGHAKYKEMLALYNKYIADFYSRMTDLESTYEESFFKTEINKINSSWKIFLFHRKDIIYCIWRKGFGYFFG